MPQTHLPQRIPVGNVRRNMAITAVLSARDLPRLAAMLAHHDWQLAVELYGGADANGRSTVSGRITGQLPLQCVRCLDAFAETLALDVEVVVAGGEDEERRLDAERDVWLADGDTLALRDCVEDEIMLALPALPTCRNPGCGAGARAF